MFSQRTREAWMMKLARRDEVQGKTENNLEGPVMYQSWKTWCILVPMTVAMHLLETWKLGAKIIASMKITFTCSLKIASLFVIAFRIYFGYNL
ncbi:unnamed protein product [Vicia faba]|uniref:Uncharacterized protein n=1 Tax=Vicia faba TaxID=3906 RepID=A0AAV1BDP0_VICFA|nr:unnamed protein product [Vicia faba]